MTVADVPPGPYAAGVPGADTLYDRDFFAWTQDQAARIRAWPEAARSNALDLAHIAEEIGDLGASQRNAAKALISRILVHLLKLRWHPGQAARRHWQEEIDAFRSTLDRIFETSPSLRASRHDLAAPEWRRAARRFALLLRRDGMEPPAEAGPGLNEADPPFDLDAEVLAEDWFPAGGEADPSH